MKIVLECEFVASYSKMLKVEQMSLSRRTVTELCSRIVMVYFTGNLVSR